MKKGMSALALMASIAAQFRGAYGVQRKPVEWNLTPQEKSIRNPKNPAKVTAQKRHFKAHKLSQLSKAKRRAVYYFNLRHPVKMFGRKTA